MPRFYICLDDTKFRTHYEQRHSHLDRVLFAMSALKYFCKVNGSRECHHYSKREVSFGHELNDSPCKEAGLPFASSDEQDLRRALP